MTLLILEGLSAGTFLYIGATEVSTDAFETCARACGEIRTGDKGGKWTESGVSICDEPVVVHGAPSRVDRFWAFSAYSCRLLRHLHVGAVRPGHEH